MDLALILLPPILSVALVLVPGPFSREAGSVPLWAWIAFVLCIDVAHVYGTLFRTYLDPMERESRRLLLTMAPLSCWLVGIGLYSVDPMLFWRTLAYLAVFHFARQQYGFLMLYSRGESTAPILHRHIDRALIYLATGYPILYWHTHLPRNFHWFVEGDFLSGLPRAAERLGLGLYACMLAAYLAKEAVNVVRSRAINVPKQLVMLGTALSWYIGIVALDGDMAFTVTNVVTHGIPYMGLVWIFGRRRAPEAALRRGFWFLPFFAGILLLLAFIEEGLWHGLVWHERLNFFFMFGWLPRIDDPETLSWLVPLLSLPQATHYVLDGFIWRLNKGDVRWQEVLFNDTGGPS